MVSKKLIFLTGLVDGQLSDSIVSTACDVWMTHIGLLMIVVADPAISPMIIDSEVLKEIGRAHV